MQSMPARHKTRAVRVGALSMGNSAPILVQSMTNTDPHDEAATLHQVRSLAASGCEIVRLTIPDREAADVLARIRPQVQVPLVADIHFDYRLALASMDAGADKIRINPGNIGHAARVAEVARAAAKCKIPIRIGVNSGSIEKRLLEQHGGPTSAALAQSALEQASLLREHGFEDIVLSAKASDVPKTVEAYQILARSCEYPLHIGITESGSVAAGSVKSAAGIGILLWQGLGDTIRVSLTGDPLPEVRVAFQILGALGLREKGPTVISCPTCGRTRIDLANLAARVEERVVDIPEPIRIAVMGCAVNGPGEAREADIGIAGGIDEGLLFRKGSIVRKVPAHDLLVAFEQELESLLSEIRSGR